ncbi:hypothetical protein [Halalkalicoccus salilacus]|uniref:hypothetical protein n=1 Tax=Halalkalicoccus salilacus TaxID=3117459 RepID=UPI00300EBC0E
MTTEPDDETTTEPTNARLDTDWSAVQRVTTETIGVDHVDKWPIPDKTVIWIRRDADMYPKGYRVAMIPLGARELRSADAFEVAHIERFDQVLPPLQHGEWTAIRRTWEAMA